MLNNGPFITGIGSGAVTASQTPGTILLGSTFQWVEAGLGGTHTVDDGGGGGNSVADALADQSGGGFNYSQTTSARPRLEDAGWNGSQSYVFDGTDDRFASTGTSIASVAGSGNDQPHTIWIAAQTFVTGTQVIYSMGNSALATNFEELFQGASNWTVRKNDAANTDATGGTVQQTYNWFRLECAGTTMTIVRNGSVDLSAGAFNTASITYNVNAIGCLRRSTFTNFLNGRVKAYVHMAGVPTTQQRTDMDNYFATMIAPKTAPMLVMTGDSHTHTATGETTWMTISASGFPGSTFVNNGVPGDTLVGMLATTGLLARYSHSIFDSNRSVVAYGNHYGANDIEGVSSRTAVQVRTDQTTWAAAVEAAHPGVPKIACTLHKIGSLPAGKEAERVAYNTDMRANYLSYGFTHLLDKDLIITELATDLTVFEGDNKHLNATGEGYLWTGRFGVNGMQQILTSIGFI